MGVEPEGKRQKGLISMASMSYVTTDSIISFNNVESSLLVTDGVAAAAAAADCCWWESGDARRLFVPCSILYGANYDVKGIMMEQIELLESVNRTARNWRNIMDKRMDHTTKSHYSESDVFSLRYRSMMYLALAFKQFVLNVTGDLRIQWTWKRCLQYAIEAMNDVGVEFYSSYATLAGWHRKFARHRFYFYKAPEAKVAIPRFLADNPDVMDAFKKHGATNIKDLRVKMMLEYVHSQLVPKLMVKQDGCLFDNDGGDAWE